MHEIVKEKYPDEFNIAYDNTCNHACSSCREKFFTADETYYANVDKITEKMLPYFNKAHKISINGRGEVFASKHMLEILEKLRPERDDFELLIETNAALFDKKHWNKLKHLGKY